MIEFLYNNKFLVSVGLASLVAVVYWKYVSMRNDADGESSAVDKDRYLYLFMAVASGVFMILYMTEDSIEDVMGEIDTGDPDF